MYNVFISGIFSNFLSWRGGGGIIKMGKSPPGCRKYVHTGRLHTRANSSIFKKSNVISFQCKNQENMKIEIN